MIKEKIVYKKHRINQFQLGYYSVKDEMKNISNVSSNVYAIESGNEIWIIDTGISEKIRINNIQYHIKYTFRSILEYFSSYHNLNIILSSTCFDTIAGLIESFDLIKYKSWKIFYTRFGHKNYKNNYQIDEFLINKLFKYEYLFPINRNSMFEICCGGYSFDDVALKLKNEQIYYPGKIISKKFYLKNLPKNENIYNYNEFLQQYSILVRILEKEHAIVLFANAVNNGIVKL